MPHTKRPRYITPLEVQDILDNCYGCDCHLAMMQCIAKGINDLLRRRPSGIISQPLPVMKKGYPKQIRDNPLNEVECST